ncbi:hypothetical protein HDU79_007083 [Rhizoclosmatium sp. JEL0117]|nr:hypothetical protein HDU79_007083 [Rhizoclosmatium sp. JEL0117]
MTWTKTTTTETKTVTEQKAGNTSIVSKTQKTTTTFKKEDVWRPADPEVAKHYFPVTSVNYPRTFEDDVALSRTQKQHVLLRVAFGHDVVAPAAREIVLNPDAKVLEVGVSDGYWIDSLYTEGGAKAEFYGVDNNAKAFEKGTKAGAKLQVADVVKGLPYEDNTFDYVHQRILISGIKVDEWPGVVAELVRVTKPGGWIELVELDSKHYNTGPETRKITDPIGGFSAQSKTDDALSDSLTGYLTSVGDKITNVETKIVSLPMYWGEGSVADLGKRHGWDREAVYLKYADAALPILGWTKEQFLEQLQKAVNEWPQTRAFNNWVAVYGQVVKK